jgi:hypothetical protein
VPPKREKSKLALAVRLLVVVQYVRETPPVPVARKKRPDNIRNTIFMRIERTNRREAGLLLVKRPDLKRGS